MIAFLSTGSASAQIAGGGGRDARIETAYAQWRRLPQREVNCVDRSLRAQHSNLWSVIQRGIEPSDSTVARIRNACRAEATARRTPAAAPKASQALAESDLRAASQLADNAADQPAVDKAAADKAEAEKAAAAAKAEALRMAEAKAKTDKTAADKAAADKAAADKVAAEKVAAEKARQLAADKAAADRAATEKAAADKAAVEKTPAKTAVVDKPVPEKPAADRPAVQKAAVAKPATQVASVAPETIEAAHARLDAGAPAKAEPPQVVLPKVVPPSVEMKTAAAFDPVAFTAAELRTSFVYGLISGPILFCLGGLAFVFLGRMKLLGRMTSVATVKPVAEVSAHDEDPRELDRRAAAAMVRQARRSRTRPAAPRREQPAAAPGLQ